MSPANGPNARNAPRSPRPPDVPPAQAHGSQDAEPEPRPGSESAAGSRQGTDPPRASRHSIRSSGPAPRSATPQPPSASSPRSAPDGPAQGARCSPPPASIARDSGTAPKSRAEAGGPNLPQPIQKLAGAPTADPKTPPIPTRQPPARHAPPRCADGFRGPGYCNAGSRIRPSPASLRSSERAAISFRRPRPSRQPQRSHSATESRERPHSGCADNSARISDNSAEPTQRPCTIRSMPGSVTQPFR